jgi:ribosome-associated toxin RatA of RatAB toxin-antitoxin module
MPGATRSIVVNAPIEKVFAVVTDYDRYGEFIPEVRKISTSNRNGNEIDVHYQIEIVKKIRYSIRMKEEKPTKLSWTFIEGEIMKDNKGSWVLSPAGEGKTNVVYNVELALGLLVPKSIVNMLTDQGLPKMLEGFKKYVESRP